MRRCKNCKAQNNQLIYLGSVMMANFEQLLIYIIMT